MNATPGPWNVERPYGETGLYIVAPNTGIIAKVWEPDSGYGYASDNARLIAAAPDLLNMLQRMVDETSGGAAPCPLTLEHARAALAKTIQS